MFAQHPIRLRELASKAVELDPKFAKTYTLLIHIEAEFSHIFRGAASDIEARAAIERALEYGRLARGLSPFDATARSCLSWLLVGEGDVKTALEIQKAALEEIILAERLSPLDMAMTTYLAIEAAIHLELGNLETAAQRALESTALMPANFDAQIPRIMALDQLGRSDDARAILADREGPGPASDYHDFVARRLALLGLAS